MNRREVRLVVKAIAVLAMIVSVPIIPLLSTFPHDKKILVCPTGQAPVAR